eukprot:TRINITY_DN91537_c0_g1_i1.p1 TRINITY_DN91537_c0_g1~~TRINITY_DN91537_c0_g1_i1.p1  ORF type:complete len:804 (+),score=148.56 TRINITY_DN91537_c0_g1_i1:27-2414(+)
MQQFFRQFVGSCMRDSQPCAPEAVEYNVNEDAYTDRAPDAVEVTSQTQILQQAQLLERAAREARERQEKEDLEAAIAASLRTPAAGSSQGIQEQKPVTARKRPSIIFQSADDAGPAALQKLSEVVANCLETNTQFIDPDFAPSTKVLYANGRCRRSEADQLLIVQHYEQAHGREIQWRRPGEIFQRPDDLMMDFASRQEMIMTMQQIAKLVEWRVFQSDPKPTDISQGALGNCWFCGSLAAVAEKPALVKRLFLDDSSRSGELSPVGVYLVRLCDGGEWRYVLLDDYFPCNRANMLAYSGARRNQLWVPLVEKAFAKLRGCYEETEGGNPSEGLRLLTGWPSVVLMLQEDKNRKRDAAADMAMRMQATCPFVDEELLWARLVSAFSADLIVCGSCGGVEGISKEMYRGAGLSPSHCYSIVKVAAARGGSLRLAKIRNPWGTGLKWKGDFSDTDVENWTAELQAEVGAEDLGADTGIFWMKLEDVRRYFMSITICPYRDGWSETRSTAYFPSSVTGPQPGFLLHCEGSPTEAILSMMQPEERQTAITMTADLGFALFQVPHADVPQTAAEESFGSNSGTRRRLKYIQSERRQNHDTVLSDLFLEQDRQHGAWLVVPLSFNQRTPHTGGGGGYAPKRFTFSCFSAKEVSMRPLELAPELLRDTLVAHVRRHGSTGTSSQGIRMMKTEEAGLVVYVENKSQFFVHVSAELGGIFNVTVSRGVEVGADGETSMTSNDVVPPMHGMIIFVAAAMPGGHSYRFSSRMRPSTDGGTGMAAHWPPLAEPRDTLHDPFFLDSGR